MNVRSLAKVAILVVAAAAIALSCSLDYRLDWWITDTRIEADGKTVSIDYVLSNDGARSMDNAMIHFVVSAQLDSGPDLVPQDAWTAGYDLAPLEQHADTIHFTFLDPIVSIPSYEVIGAGWDEDSSD